MLHVKMLPHRYPKSWERNPNYPVVRVLVAVRQNERRQKWISARHCEGLVCVYKGQLYKEIIVTAFRLTRRSLTVLTLNSCWMQDEPQNNAGACQHSKNAIPLRQQRKGAQNNSKKP